MTESAAIAARRAKDAFFRDDPQSPLTPEQRAVFTGLRYYPYDPALVLTVTVEPAAGDTRISIPTTSGDSRRYRSYGRFTFTVAGQTAQLTIYEADYGFFLPFVDANAGSETYPAGRYLEPELLGSYHFYVDFNAAYNPYCVYGPGWSCPITPAENRLAVAVRAGEMLPLGPWVAET